MNVPTVNGFSSMYNPLVGKLANYTRKCIANEGFFVLNNSGNEYKVVLCRKQKDLKDFHYIKVIQRFTAQNKKLCTFVKYKAKTLMNGLSADGFLYKDMEKRGDTRVKYIADVDEKKRAVLQKVFQYVFNALVINGNEYYTFDPKILVDKNILHIFMKGIAVLLTDNKFGESLRSKEDKARFKSYPDKTIEARNAIVQSINKDTYPVENLDYVSADMTITQKLNEWHCNKAKRLGDADRIREKCGNMQTGGNILSKTQLKVMTPRGERCVYEGPRGGKYIRVSGKYVRLQLS